MFILYVLHLMCYMKVIDTHKCIYAYGINRYSCIRISIENRNICCQNSIAHMFNTCFTCF